jgi:hypothetical protein
MKEFLQGNIANVTDEYIAKLLYYHENLIKKEGVLAKKQADADAEREVLKSLQKDCEAKLIIDKQKLADQVVAYKNKYDNLQAEVNRYNKLNKSLQDEVKQASVLTRDSETTRDLTTKELGKQRDKTKAYEEKTKLLQIDDDKLSAREKTVETREQKVSAREKKAYRHESDNIAKGQILAERELDVRGKEKRIAFEYKKLKIDG